MAYPQLTYFVTTASSELSVTATSMIQPPGVAISDRMTTWSDVTWIAAPEPPVDSSSSSQEATMEARCLRGGGADGL